MPDLTALAQKIEAASVEQAAMLYVRFSELAAQAKMRVLLGTKVADSGPALDAKEAARLLGIKVRTLYAKARSFPFTFYPLDGRPRFDRAKLLKWRDAQRG